MGQYVPHIDLERTTEVENGDTVSVRLFTPLITGNLSYNEAGDVRWEIFGLNYSDSGTNKTNGILVVEREVLSKMRNYVAGILNSLQ